MATRARFVDKDMLIYQRELAIANVKPGKTAVAVKSKFGVRLTRRQVANHQGLAQVATDLADAEDLQADRTKQSELDILSHMLKQKGARRKMSLLSYLSRRRRKTTTARLRRSVQRYRKYCG